MPPKCVWSIDRDAPCSDYPLPQLKPACSLPSHHTTLCPSNIDINLTFRSAFVIQFNLQTDSHCSCVCEICHDIFSLFQVTNMLDSREGISFIFFNETAFKRKVITLWFTYLSYRFWINSKYCLKNFTIQLRSILEFVIVFPVHRFRCHLKYLEWWTLLKTSK